MRIPHLVAGSLLLLATALNLANVVGRYAFATPVSWAEEALSFMIIWAVYIAAGSIVYRGSHLTMDFVATRLGPAYHKFLGLLTFALTVICSAFVVTQSVRILALYLRTGETSMAARIPLLYAHSAIVVGFALMGVAALIRVRAYLTQTFD